MSETKIGPDAVYAEYLEAGDWHIQKCRGCGDHVFVPRGFCPSCQGDDLEWVCPSGRGTIYSTTVIRQKEELGGIRNLVLVDLEEGVRMMSRVDGRAPEAVEIGLSVTADLIAEDGQNKIVFRAVGDAS
ncbi:MAG: DNA-binding protein [Rhodospirillaceae bacterium]|nr:DNA-binding protein [Rhodospirillaceae bacterium]